MNEDYLFFYIILCFPLVSWIILKYMGINNKYYYPIINFLLMFLCVGLRDINIGTDTIVYINAFEYVANVDISAWVIGNFEWGYVVLNKLMYFCGLPARSVLLLVAFFTIGIIIYVFCAYSCNIWMSLYLFVGLGLYGYTFNIIRQTLAAAIVMLAVCILSKGKRVFFLILVLMGASFHESVILFLPLVFIYDAGKKHIFVYFLTCIILMIIICAFGLEFFDFFINNSKYILYIGGTRLQETKFGFGVVKIVLSIILGLIGVHVYFKNLCKDKLLILSSLLVFTAGIFAFVSYYMELVGRFTYNYFLFTTILIPQLLSYSQLRKNICFIYSFAISVFIWFCVYFLSIRGSI